MKIWTSDAGTRAGMKGDWMVEVKVVLPECEVFRCGTCNTWKRGDEEVEGSRYT